MGSVPLWSQEEPEWLRRWEGATTHVFLQLCQKDCQPIFQSNSTIINLNIDKKYWLVPSSWILFPHSVKSNPDFSFHFKHHFHREGSLHWPLVLCNVLSFPSAHVTHQAIIYLPWWLYDYCHSHGLKISWEQESCMFLFITLSPAPSRMSGPTAGAQLISVWINLWIDGWVDGWIDGQVDKWMNEEINKLNLRSRIWLTK